MSTVAKDLVVNSPHVFLTCPYSESVVLWLLRVDHPPEMPFSIEIVTELPGFGSEYEICGLWTFMKEAP